MTASLSGWVVKRFIIWWKNILGFWNTKYRPSRSVLMSQIHPEMSSNYYMFTIFSLKNPKQEEMVTVNKSNKLHHLQRFTAWNYLPLTAQSHVLLSEYLSRVKEFILACSRINNLPDSPVFQDNRFKTWRWFLPLEACSSIFHVILSASAWFVYNKEAQMFPLFMLIISRLLEGSVHLTHNHDVYQVQRVGEIEHLPGAL